MIKAKVIMAETVQASILVKKVYLFMMKTQPKILKVKKQKMTDKNREELKSLIRELSCCKRRRRRMNRGAHKSLSVILETS